MGFLTKGTINSQDHMKSKTIVKKIELLAASIFTSAILSACGTAIPPEKYGDYAFIVSGVADGPYRCEPGTPSCSVFIGYIDGRVQGLAAPKFVVKPGLHTFQLGVQPLTDEYRFVALGGHRYILKEGKILVSLRSDPNQSIVDELVPFSGQYISVEEAKEKARAKAQASEKAFRQQQSIDMPRIRKVGAEVCLYATTAQGDIREHGYVEKVVDNKIKIRVDRGTLGDREIWDFPDSWFLCGHN